MIEHKQKLLVSSVKTKKIKVSWHDPNVSMLEAVLAKGDRRLSQVIYKAWQKGCKFDSWSEYYKYDKWLEAFDECNISPEFYANRQRPYDEILPWDHLDYYVSKEFFVRENQTARAGKTTPNCRQRCSACGLVKETGVKCFE